MNKYLYMLKEFMTILKLGIFRRCILLKRNSLKAITLIVISLVVLGMGVDESLAATWTILVYLDGDNNLEPYGIDDFEEMATVGSNTNVNILVQMDRISGYSTEYGDWTSTKRFRVTSGMTPTAANALSDLGEVNMGDPATLTSFINWGVTNYPATHYALVLWDHGSGWEKREDLVYKAVCWDDTNGGDPLYMKEVKNAMNAASTDMTLIGFDACLMGMIEVAYELRNTGPTVMVASEETEPGAGWPYNTILADLVANPTWSASQLGTAIVNRYYASYGNDETMAAIDMTQINTLATQVSSFANTMRTSWNINPAAVKTSAQTVMTGIDAAVIHELHGGGWPGSHGLAIYFPSTIGSFDADYTGTTIDFPANTLWEEFLADFYASMGGSWVATARSSSQDYTYPEHIDLYDFCDRLVNPSYCTSSSSTYTDEYISRVQFNTGDQSSGSSSYTLVPGVFTTLTPGASYTLSVTGTTIGAWTEFVKAWIDFNQDLAFGTGEEFSLGSYTFPSGGGTHVYTQTIPVPASATTGNTRMRVILKYNSVPTACGSYGYGETEDYTVAIGGTTPSSYLLWTK